MNKSGKSQLWKFRKDDDEEENEQDDTKKRRGLSVKKIEGGG